ncbi:Methylamine utilization protein MauE [compost metagenome]
MKRRSATGREKVVSWISYCFILLFLYAAMSKLMDYQEFKVQLSQSPILMDYAAVLVWLVPVVEIVIAIMLAFKKTMLPGMFAAFGLMAMFSVYILMILYSGERIPCSCGGLLEKMSWQQHLVFNIVFVVLGIVGIVLQSVISREAKRREISPIRSRRP